MDAERKPRSVVESEERWGTGTIESGRAFRKAGRGSILVDEKWEWEGGADQFPANGGKESQGKTREEGLPGFPLLELFS